MVRWLSVALIISLRGELVQLRGGLESQDLLISTIFYIDLILLKLECD